MNSLIKPECVYYPELSYVLTGLLFKVHNNLGQYCSERQYGDLLAQELQNLSIPFQREYRLPATFSGEIVGRNKLDFLIDDKIILELKACKVLTKLEYSQTLRYLQASHKKLAILVNFHTKYIQPKRILNSLVSE